MEREFENAVADATRSIELNDKADKSVKFARYHIRAYAKAQLKDYGGALEDLDKAIQLQPQTQKYWRNAASVRVWQNDFKAAEEESRRR